MTKKEQRSLLGFLAIGAGFLALSKEAPVTGACLILGGAALIDPPTAARVADAISKKIRIDNPPPPPTPNPIIVISQQQQT